MTGREQAFGVLQLISHVKQPFGTLANITDWKLHLDSLLRSYVQVFHAPAAHHLSCFQHLPFQIICRQVAEEIFVENADFTILDVCRICPNVLIEIAYFVHVRIRYAVRANQTVVAEIEVRSIETVKVTAVCINHLSVLSRPANRLIDKVPNESALILRIFADEVPIFLETAFRVTHGMGIFTLNERFLIFFILAIIFATFVT